MDSCLHKLKKLEPPEPAPTGKPFRYECQLCGKKLKIASGFLPLEVKS